MGTLKKAMEITIEFILMKAETKEEGTKKYRAKSEILLDQ